MLRASIAFRDGALALIAIESAESYSRRADRHWNWQVGGIVRPVAVVVCGPDGPYAVDMQANPVDLDELKRDVPDLDAAIASVT